MFTWSKDHGEAVVEVDVASRLAVTVLEATGVPSESAHHVYVAAADNANELVGDGERLLVAASRYAWDLPIGRDPIVLAEGDSVAGKVALACPRAGAFVVVVASGATTVRTVAVDAVDANEQAVTVTLPAAVDVSGTIGPTALLQEIHPGWPEYWRDSGRPESERLLANFAPTVIAISADRTPEEGRSWQTPIGADGAFRFDHLPHGKWTLHLSYHLPESTATIVHRTGVLGTFEWWNARRVHETFDATALVPARVQVVCRGHDGALVGARVQVFEAGSTKEIGGGVTDAWGALRVRLQPGPYAVRTFGATTRQREDAALRVTAGSREYELDLGTSDVVVEARDAAGAKLAAGRRMRLKVPDLGWSSAVVATDGDGAAKFAGVPRQPGDSLLEVEAAGEWQSHRIEGSRFAAATSPRVVRVVLSR
ncbi:MAG: hypothetical protein Q7T30_00250 [Planctomycetota bacterium]|nr:hypothetical protein [Planctomycetota bacterium]